MSAVSALLLQSGILTFLFLIPIQVLWVRWGNRALIGSGIALLFILILDLLFSGGGSGASSRIILIESLFPAVALAGLACINISIPTVEHKFPWVQRRLYRMMVAVGLAMIILFPSIYILISNETIKTELYNQFLIFLNSMPFLLETSEFDAASLTYLINATLEIMASFFCIGYIGMFGISWFFGTNIGNLSLKRPSISLRHFSLPHWFLWGTIVALAFALLDVVMPLGAIRYIIRNITSIFLTFYAVQGIMILLSLIEKRTHRNNIRVICMIAIGLSLFVVILNIIVIVGLIGLGISEEWVDWRHKKRYTTTQLKGTDDNENKTNSS